MKPTDMKKVKDVAKSLAYLEPEFTEYGIVLHPYINCQFIPRKGSIDIREAYDITKPEDMMHVREDICKMIDRIEDYHTFSFYLSKPYLTAFFKYTKDYLSIKDYSEFLGDLWVQVEFTNKDPNISPNEFIKLFKKADQQYLMEEDEKEFLASLDEEVTIYRGVKPKSSTKALSWTTQLTTAKWFADRLEKNGKVYKANIKKKDILALFLRRGEFETVVDYHKLYNVEEMSKDDLI